MQTPKGLLLVTRVLYLIFLVSLVCSFRAISSISIGLIFLAGIVKNKLETNTFFHPHVINPFLAGCILLFCTHLLALFYTQNITEGWKDARLSTGLVITPLAVCCTNYITGATRNKLLFYFSLVLAAASLYCLVAAFIHYFQSGDPSSFFYHALVKPLRHHAVYYSILVFIALSFLLERLAKNTAPAMKYFYISVVIFLSVFLFLLSSKLVLAFYTLYLICFFIRLVKNKYPNRALIGGLLLTVLLMTGLALVTTNPVSKRFFDITKGDLKVVTRERFDPGMYFNGLQFRLLQWKFTPEILSENQRWLIGMSPGDTRYFLNQKYIDAKMYTGGPGKGDKGFLIYNTHNQFLETLLQTGLTGLVVLCFTWICLVRLARAKKRPALNALVLLLLAWFFTESVLETQYGIMIFTFFPLFFSQD